MPRTSEEINAFLEAAEKAVDGRPLEGVDDEVREFLRTYAPTREEWIQRTHGGTDEDELDELEAEDEDEDDKPELWRRLSDDDFRARVFAAAAPLLAEHLERMWQQGRYFPQGGYLFYAGHYGINRPFHLRPGVPTDDGDARAWNSMAWLLARGRTYGLDLPTLVRYAGHANVDTTALGTAAALAIDAGDAALASLVQGLLDGTEPDGEWNPVLVVALLRQQDPAAWAQAHDLLLRAERQEGLRETILSAAGEALAEPFIETLRVVVEHDLIRFAGVAATVGMWLDADLQTSRRAANTKVVADALALLDDAGAREELLSSERADDVARALDANAMLDVRASLEQASQLLEHDAAPIRAAAIRHITACSNFSGTRHLLVRALADPELRIVAEAIKQLTSTSFRAPVTLSDEIAHDLMERLPAKSASLDGLGTLLPASCSKSEIAWLLINEPKAPRLDLVVQHVDALDANTRGILLNKHTHRMARDHRDVVVRLIADAAESVRMVVSMALKEITLTPEEATDLEPLLRRKAGDLRQLVLGQIAAQGAEHALQAAERLLAERAEPLRLGGVDLLGRLAADGNTDAIARLSALQPGVPAGALADAVATALAGAREAGGDTEASTETTAFGLMDPSQLTAPRVPVAPGTVFVDDATLALISGLSEWCEAHAAHELVLTPTDPENESEPSHTTVGGLFEWFVRDRDWDAEFDALVRPVVAALLPKDAEEASVVLMRAAWLLRHAAIDWFPNGSPKRRDMVRDRVLEGATLPTVNQAAVIGIISKISDEQRTPATVDWTLDAAEELLALDLPPQKTNADAWYVNQGRTMLAADAGQQLVRAQQPWSAEQASRLWGLLRWLMDESEPLTPADLKRFEWVHPAEGDRIPRRPELAVFLSVVATGVLTDADVFDELIGPREAQGGWHTLARLTGLKKLDFAISEHTRELARIARQRVTDLELARGEGPTPVTRAACALEISGGMDVLIRAVRALGKDRLERGWSHSDGTRSASFSHLILTSLPGDGDTPEAFAARATDTGASRQRLLEVACYAPQWAEHIEAAVGVAGLADGIWWVHAHTKDDQWRAGWDLRERWRAAVAERTDLSDEDLTDGAVDVEWFGRVRAAIGPKLLGELLGAAKFASSGSGHKRAELFALALEGKVPTKELRTKIVSKRHQDSVRALGLRPLSPARREADLQERYALLQQFLRERMQFGSQRQVSEARAAEIGLANLARTAGYRDPVRLAWAMEAQGAADLVAGVTAVDGDLSVTLRVDVSGLPELVAQRGDRALKSIPPASRKHKALAELLDRQKELRRTHRRVRASLELAMTRADAFSGAELSRLRDHAVLWPQLRELVLVIGESTGAVLGYPADDEAALVDPSGTRTPIAPDAELRIAHVVDLLDSGTWQDWQRTLFSEQRSQPFKQVFRELYVPIDAEQDPESIGVSRRYAGHQVRERQARALLKARSWEFEDWAPPRRVLRTDDVLVEADVVQAWGTALEVAPPIVDTVTFRSLSTRKPLALAEVPRRAFSEVMRDLDLVVSVAHASGIDPDASLSTVEARGALVEHTVDLLGIDGVEVQERRVLVKGTLGSYGVHLGSGQVTQHPGGSVCIVPVSAQERGRIFLPFADDDPRSAEILSKVLLLVRDHEIKDESILAQLRR